MKGVLKEASVIAVVSSLVGVGVDLVREDGIPLIAKKRYEIYVPCPVPSGKITEILPSDLPGLPKERIYVDARPKEDFEKGHVRNALNVPYDYLEPVSKDVLRYLASRGAKAVVVYGDGADPDCGRLLAKELSAGGIRHVYFVKGGITGLCSVISCVH